MTSAPPPTLRIVPIDAIHSHEEHDSQRSLPLLDVIRHAETLTNPPIVAEMGDGEYVMLDGANRHFCFRELGYEHLLVQVGDYETEFVELGVWQHVIRDWSQEAFTEALYSLPDATVEQGWNHQAVAQILLHDGPVLSVDAPNESVEERNQTLREMVHLYQQRAKLNRTALTDPTMIWPLYPSAIAVVLFPPYEPQDIIRAAQHNALLPPGVSRHIIQGRALKLHYPLTWLRDEHLSLEAKNAHLQEWLQEKMANRAVRFYAESTYLFDE